MRHQVKNRCDKKAAMRLHETGSRSHWKRQNVIFLYLRCDFVVIKWRIGFAIFCKGRVSEGHRYSVDYSKLRQGKVRNELKVWFFGYACRPSSARTKWIDLNRGTESILIAHGTDVCVCVCESVSMCTLAYWWCVDSMQTKWTAWFKTQSK